MLYPDGRLAGLVAEVDLLKHMLKARHGHSPEETIEDIAQPADTLLPAGARLQAGLPAIAEDQVVLLTEQDQPVGILTKIDILDFIAQRIGLIRPQHCRLMPSGV